jgi:hypothetical protein
MGRSARDVTLTKAEFPVPRAPHVRSVEPMIAISVGVPTRNEFGNVDALLDRLEPLPVDAAAEGTSSMTATMRRLPGARQGCGQSGAPDPAHPPPRGPKRFGPARRYLTFSAAAHVTLLLLRVPLLAVLIGGLRMHYLAAKRRISLGSFAARLATADRLIY